LIFEELEYFWNSGNFCGLASGPGMLHMHSMPASMTVIMMRSRNKQSPKEACMKALTPNNP
jgi:hypothetical protein